MSFYENLKTFLIEDIGTYTHKKIKIYNDITDDFLNSAPKEEELYLFIQTGAGTTSKMQGLSLTLYPITIIALANQNALQDTINSLTEYINYINGKTFREATQDYFNLGLELPSVMQTDINIDTTDDVVKAATISILGSCLVSAEPIGQQTIEIDYGQGYKPIPTIAGYTDNYNVDASSISEKGELLNLLSVNGVNRDITCDIKKLVNNEVYNYFDSCRTDFIVDLVKIRKDNHEFNAVITSISEGKQTPIGIPSIHVVIKIVRA